MLQNYFNVALRNIYRNKKYTLINLTGLTMGIVCALFIFTYVRDEYSYDRFHGNVESVYQVLSQTDVKNNAVTPVPLGPVLEEEFPEIESMTRYHWMWGETVMSHGDKTFVENGLRLADPSFFTIFSFAFLKGNPLTSLSNINSIVITEETARKYFADGDPLGKILTMNHEHEFTVTGMIEETPHNSTLLFDMVIPIQFNISNFDSWYMDWGNLFVYTFIQCRPGCPEKQINVNIARTVAKHGGQKDLTLTVLPFTDRHFFFHADQTTARAFLAVAVFILIIACFNFMNLATARSARRAGEVGMRKVVGAGRAQILSQYLGESLLTTVLAGCIAVGLYILLFPLFLSITAKQIDIPYAFILPCSLAVTLFTGLAAGSYPALFLSRFNVLHILKGSTLSGTRGSLFRKSVVTIQFALSILLLLGTVVVYRQTRFIQGKDIGYNRENIVSIPMGGGSEHSFQIFKNEVLKNPDIAGVTGTAAAMPFVNWRINAFSWEGTDPDTKPSISFNAVDHDFVETLRIRMIEGRSFADETFSEQSFSLLVNEEMARLMNTDAVLGATITRGDQPGTVVGVVENYHYNSLRYQIEPLILQLNPREVDNLLIRIHPEHTNAALSFIEQTWKTVIPDYPFNYTFLDEAYETSVVGLKRTGRLLAVFSLLAALISCLGLLGLSSYVVEQRTKEIGIRKVLGSSLPQIVHLISKEFVALVCLANMIVWPLAYVMMNAWLRDFAYRTSIEWWIFAAAVGLVLVLSLLTVGLQSIKAALADPVKSLKYE